MKKYLNKFYILYIICNLYVYSSGNYKLSDEIITKNSKFLFTNEELIEQEKNELILELKVMKINDFSYPFDKYLFYKNGKYIITRFSNSDLTSNGFVLGGELVSEYNFMKLIDLLKEFESEKEFFEFEITCKNCNILENKVSKKGITSNGEDIYEKKQVEVFWGEKQIDNNVKILEISLDYPIKSSLLNRKKVFLLLNDKELYENNKLKNLIDFFNTIIID